MSKRYAVIGVDAGGTKTAGVLATPSGEVIARSRSGPANYHGMGRDPAAQSLAAVVRPLAQAAADAGRQVLAAGFGIAALDRPQDRAVLGPIVDTITPDGAAPVLVNDTFVILRAGTPDGVGVAVVSGTGPNTVGWGVDGAETRIGGMASELGDFGGGGDIGLEALRAARRGEDGRGPHTSLLERILDFAGVEEITDLLDAFIADAKQSLPPSLLAPLVFDAAAEGDRVAEDILLAAGRELGLCARIVAGRLFAPGDAFPLVLGGSVLQRGRLPLLRDAIISAVRSDFPQVHPRVLDTAPVCGGVLLALDRVHGHRGGAKLPEAAELPPWFDATLQTRYAEALREQTTERSEA